MSIHEHQKQSLITAQDDLQSSAKNFLWWLQLAPSLTPIMHAVIKFKLT